jgi:UDP-glucose 4-epimerase
MLHDEYGVFNWFIRKAIDGEIIPIFGDGRILRDYLYVDDLVDALLMTASEENAFGKVYNVGSGVPLNFIDLAKKIIEITESGKIDFTQFTTERKALEPGDYYADITKIKKEIGWKPKTSLENGISSTVQYYRNFKKHYW